MPTCKTPGCHREPLQLEIVAILGENVAGLCDQCAVPLLDSDLPCTSRPSDIEQVTDRSEHNAYVNLNPDDKEVLGGRLAQPEVVDDGLADLRRLREQDEEAEGRLLRDRDRKIVDAALRLDRVQYARIATELGLHRSTVWRRVQLLRALAAARKRMTDPRDWERFMKLLMTQAGAPGGLDRDSFDEVMAVYRARRRVPLPPTGLKVERRGEKLLITGHGPLSPILQEAVRTGRAERIFPGPPRCHACGRFVSRPPTGRRPKYCSERCRSRYRRRR